MSEFSTHIDGNPRPGVVFEHSAEGERVILNPDLTFTSVKDGQVSTFIPSLDQLEMWQLDAYEAVQGINPDVRVGEVGWRMARNFELHLMDLRQWRSDLAC